jgi:hypothetical protein
MLSILKAKTSSKFVFTTQRSLQVCPKILKKNYQNTKSTDQNENIPKKNNVEYLKSVQK